MDKTLSFVEDRRDLVVVEHNCKTPLDVALNPEFSLDDAYYSITKGQEHVFTVVKKDGSTHSFSFGSSGYDLISQATMKLKERVLAFLKENDCFIDLTSRIASFLISDHDNRVDLIIRDAMENAQLLVFPTVQAAKEKAESIAKRKLSWEKWENCSYKGIKAYIK